MKILKSLITALLISLFIFFIFNNGVTGQQSCQGLSTEQCNDLINKTQIQLDSVRAQKNTLSSQIQFMDTQIYLTTLKIQDAQQQITRTEEEIETLGGRIQGVNDSLDYLTKLLFNKIKEGYKRRDIPFFNILLDSDNASTLFNQLKYTQIAQENDRRVAFQLQQAKQNFEDQKDLRERKVQELENLRASLNNHNIDLENQRIQKQQLLAVTKNDERNFQTLLARLRADAASIGRALSLVGVKIGDVKRGDIIASVGSTGCSTGSHLHLEVMTSARVENGVVIGRENKVDPKPYIDSGQFPRPTASYTGNDCSVGSFCNQGDITTTFRQWYDVLGGSYHTGLDVADYYGSAIYAAGDGVAYAIQDSSACSLTGTVGKGIVIDHLNGMVTLYWHIP